MEFVFVSGNVALDFVGTRQHRRQEAVDLLDTGTALGEWAQQAGLVDDPPATDGTDLTVAVDLREALYRLFLSAAADGGYAPEDCAAVNHAAEEPPTVRLLLPARRPPSSARAAAERHAQ